MFLKYCVDTGVTPGKATQKQKQLSRDISNHTLWGRQPPDSDQAVPYTKQKPPHHNHYFQKENIKYQLLQCIN